MAKIEKSDLNSSSISSIKSLLGKEISDSENLISCLSNFVNDTSDELKGPGFDAVRNKVSTYITALTERQKAAQSLLDSITSGISTMNSFMESYDMLDDSELLTLNTEINSIQATISNLEYSYYKGLYKDENGKNRVSLNSLVGSYKNQLTKLKKLQEKLNQLSSTDQQAYSSIESAKDLVITYKSSVSNITESSIV